MMKESKFVVLKFDKNNTSLIDFFNSLFECEYIIRKDYFIYKLDNEKAYKEYNLKNMIELIKLDFNTDINIFESCILNDKNIKDFDIIFDIYNNCKHKDYLNMASLSLILFNDKESNNQLNDIKNIINKIMKENEGFIDISKAMFKNNLNVSRSASDAFMHRNTLISKLDILNKKTGFNIQNFQDAFILYLFINKH